MATSLKHKHRSSRANQYNHIPSFFAVNAQEKLKIRMEKEMRANLLSHKEETTSEEIVEG